MFHVLERPHAQRGQDSCPLCVRHPGTTSPVGFPSPAAAGLTASWGTIPLLYCYSYPEEEAERSHRLFPVTQQGCDEPEPRHALLTPDTELSVTRCVLKSSTGQSQLTGCGNGGGRVAGFCLSAEQRAGGVCLLVRRVSALGACHTWHLSICYNLGSWDPTEILRRCVGTAAAWGALDAWGFAPRNPFLQGAAVWEAFKTGQFFSVFLLVSKRCVWSMHWCEMITLYLLNQNSHFAMELCDLSFMSHKLCVWTQWAKCSRSNNCAVVVCCQQGFKASAVSIFK